MRTNNACFHVAPRMLSLELFGFRLTFCEVAASGHSFEVEIDRRGGRAHLLLARLGSTRGANGEGKTDEGDRTGGGGTGR